MMSRWLLRLAELNLRRHLRQSRLLACPYRVAQLPRLSQCMDDLRAVMPNAANMEEGRVCIGILQGGPLTTLLSPRRIRYRCRALVLYGCFARFATSSGP